jgi:cysteine desulfurase
MVAALEESDGLKATAVALRRGWKERFEHELVRALPQTRIIGMDTERLWNTTMAILPAAENQRWLTKLDRRGFQVSTSAACTAAQGLPSPVLAAMGIGAADARRALRFSSGLETTEADWNALLDALTAVAGELAGAEMST